ncbi:MAG: hypothetical protein AB7I27_16375 [Bacteriovoracaceae bacterium]
MKTIFFLMSGILFVAGSFTTQAHAAIPGYYCSAQCMGIDTNNKQVEFLGEASAVAPSKLTAWRSANKRCEKRAAKAGLNYVLVKDSIYYSARNSTQTGDSHRYARSWYRVSQDYSRYYNEQNELSFELKFASPQSACSEEQVEEEETIPEYEGDLPVLG